MAKNSEYGAVVYLAHSKYGVNKQKIMQNNDTNYYTGGSSTEETIYTTNQKQSTTYNATGVYDLNGGGVQNTASYVNYTSSSYLKNNGGTNKGDLYGETQEERATSTSYKMVYIGTGTPSINMGKTENIKGDAIFEIANSSASENGVWFSAPSKFPSSDVPFFGRGSKAGNANASMFRIGGNSGISTDYYSFSTILIF